VRPASKGLVAALLLLAAYSPGRLPAQGVRAAGWAGYEDVTDDRDWTVLGGQLTLVGRRGHGAWLAAERLGRFGARDVTARLGGVLHPGARWWLTAEVATSAAPAFAPRNAWEADASTLLGPRTGAGLGYRRQNYRMGAVNVVMPHLRLEAGRTWWDARVYVSRNPSERTDVAFLIRATRPAGRRATVWVGGGAGRESYVVGIPPVVQSLETVTGIAGVRYTAAGGTTFRVDLSIVRSRPVLSRRGVTVGIARGF
jgi:YaiO family outer membrane protein